MSDLTNFYCQRNPRYLNSPIGKGVGGSDLYHYGCYFISLCRKLNVDPIVLNAYMVSIGLWDDNNYILVDKLAQKMPTVFKEFYYTSDFTIEQYEMVVNKQNIAVICQVSAVAIGGTGTHFVQGTKRDGFNAVVFDPWFGDEIKVATRYGNYGNILQLKVFGMVDNWQVNLKNLLNPIPELEGLSKVIGYDPTFIGQDIMHNSIHYKSVVDGTKLIWQIVATSSSSVSPSISPSSSESLSMSNSSSPSISPSSSSSGSPSPSASIDDSQDTNDSPPITETQSYWQIIFEFFYEIWKRLSGTKKTIS